MGILVLLYRWGILINPNSISIVTEQYKSFKILQNPPTAFFVEGVTCRVKVVVCSLFTVYLLVCLFVVCLLFLLSWCLFMLFVRMCSVPVCLFFFVLLHGCSSESLSTSSSELFRQSCRPVFFLQYLFCLFLSFFLCVILCAFLSFDV